MKPGCEVLFFALLTLIAGVPAAPSDPRPGAHRVLPLQELSIGSHEAKKGEFPFQVLLHNNAGLWCGASILTHHTVVTAAHCIEDSMDDFEAVAGDHNLAEEEGTEQRRKIKRTIKHEDFQTFHEVGNSVNDIAVILLEKPFVFNDFVQPVPVARAGAVISGPITLSGWGILKGVRGGQRPDILRTEELPVEDLPLCVRALAVIAPKFRDFMMPDTVLCTGPLSGGMGPCAGDSGSPMVKNGVLVGIVSWSPIPCGVANIPYGNTNVSSFTDWILRTDREIRRPVKPKDQQILGGHLFNRIT